MKNKKVYHIYWTNEHEQLDGVIIRKTWFGALRTISHLRREGCRSIEVDVHDKIDDMERLEAYENALYKLRRCFKMDLIVEGICYPKQFSDEDREVLRRALEYLR